ncbi:MAG: rRNA maturation RNase YbeY [Rhodobacteraceae bacterium]|nr:rRNA maturation RNase YbeY [Paracoccaceae bacterium]
MPVETICEDPRWEAENLPAVAEAASEAALRHLGLDPARFEIAVLAADDARIAALNADFRGKPQPTNVLSWPSQERGAAREGDAPAPPSPGTPEDPAPLGDIALAWETCLREAEEAGKALADHVRHLVVHGVLHLLGYDHVRDGDAALMERLEVEILASLGVADPYSPTGPGPRDAEGER